ncbi:inorganic diphosphatase [Streptomyces sp. NPDC008122]|uniref:inorganic diphosphatase n=1 Tax=Streptomyces sp. NPDC008122 TaxID=3364810 RepID=UPI0036E02315
MPRSAIAVDAAAGSTINRDDVSLASAPTERHRLTCRPTGHGRVAGTLGDDGRPLEALVPMREPAVPGAGLPARPVAVLHLAARGRMVDEVLRVAEGFTGLADARGLPRWHAEPGAWAGALTRLTPGTSYHVTGCGPAGEAEELLAQGGHAYLQLTGCLE